ncbi:hypothetical protein caldi_19580 [Caldinitratiruptor microaerophilus]|uniref:Uncharacterized protein n=1 Tax=Caldinitratiruptor microaerophilus TaxID=671077 RepID=A0AA35CM20_9FIRM|nr:hypothetical protein caldi_19580 [Caldinitratiruptor microaerophilus]
MPSAWHPTPRRFSIRPAIFLAEAAHRSASRRTSSATTANPHPRSPVRAASLAAVSASRFVYSAIPEISWVVSPIWFDIPSGLRMRLADPEIGSAHHRPPHAVPVVTR